MHKMVEELIKKSKAEIAEYQRRDSKFVNSLYDKEIADEELRIKELKRLNTKYESTELYKLMNAIVEKKVEGYHADFYFHDLILMEKWGPGRFAWSVGNCGTHMLWLDNENEEMETNQKNWVDALKSNYGHYTVYEGDMEKQTLKKTTYDELTFRILSKS